MVFDFDRFLSLNEIDQIYSISMNGNETRCFYRKAIRKETISKRYDHWDYHEHKEARKWKNSLLYASATARVIYHGNT